MHSESKKELTSGLKQLLLAIIVVYSAYTILSHNGLFDSRRTKEAIRDYNANNPIKTVKNVQEEWSDNKFYAPMMDGYNPRVLRTVKFEDGTQTTLDYRVYAWPLVKKIVSGETFNPKPGEKYQVNKNNNLINLIEK